MVIQLQTMNMLVMSLLACMLVLVLASISRIQKVEMFIR